MTSSGVRPVFSMEDSTVVSPRGWLVVEVSLVVVTVIMVLPGRAALSVSGVDRDLENP